MYKIDELPFLVLPCRVCGRDCPDLFDIVPENSIGACLEDEKVRQPRETEAYVRLSCLLYNVSHISDNTKNCPAIIPCV